MKTNFYDIESLANVFTLANYKPDENTIDVYYLVDDPDILDVSQLIPGGNPGFLALERLVKQRVRDSNKNFDGTVSLYDLRLEPANVHLARTFGLSDAPSVNNPGHVSTYPAEFRPVCDTDPDYDPDVHPYLMGYNSYNYDTTELALYFYETWPYDGQQGVHFQPTTAALMREYNNELFSAKFKSNMPMRLACQNMTKAVGGRRQVGVSWSQPDYSLPQWAIRKNMLMSGRHIDVARLNEKSVKVGLKRLLGMLGGQILESDKLRPGQDRINSLDEFLDLIAYNASDVINLKVKLFDHPVYQGQFSLKRALLRTYPELVYERDPNQSMHAPLVSQETVRRDRLFIDSSSAQLATKALCPYGHLTDIPAVSFMYPSEAKSKELGIPRVNVLEECKKFFYEKFPQPEIRAEFDRIYAYYKSIEGRNFNESKNYQADWDNRTPVDPMTGQPYIDPKTGKPYVNAMMPPNDTRALPKQNTCMYYYNPDGTPSSCFTTFSIGGIHGAEYNKALYEAHMAEFEHECELMQQVQTQYPDPVELKRAKHVVIKDPDTGEEVKYPAGRFLKTGSTLLKAAYKNPYEKAPQLFKIGDDGGAKLNPKYVFTSADPTNHEDFTSYYPNLLRMMSAFYNPGLGYDRYAEIFYQKQDLGVLMKEKNADYAKLKTKFSPDEIARFEKLRAMTGLRLDPDVISDEERAVYAVQREGTKLILNSASGAADATFESNIRMNNQIISMRIIGQLFSWRIGTAQTFYGAKITSTNTDGLYSVMETELNNQVLARESHDIGVEIEPEPTYLISKDTNNRIELDMGTGKVQSASGGTLACQSWAGKKGPSPTKNLAHPAIIDWALCEYLIFAATDRSGRAAIDLPFNPEVGKNILKSAIQKFTPVRALNMFQNVVASSPSSMSYVFYTKPSDPGNAIPTQHYNRVFIMRPGYPGTVNLHVAASRKLTPAQIKKRESEPNTRVQQHDPVALEILEINGVKPSEIPPTNEAIVKKVTNIDDSWDMLIENRDLEYIPDADVQDIINGLDLGKYLQLLGDCFEQNWRNHLPGGLPETDLAPYAAHGIDWVPETQDSPDSVIKSAKPTRKSKAAKSVRPANPDAAVTADNAPEKPQDDAGTKPVPGPADAAESAQAAPQAAPEPDSNRGTEPERIPVPVPEAKPASDKSPEDCELPWDEVPAMPESPTPGPDRLPPDPLGAVQGHLRHAIELIDRLSDTPGLEQDEMVLLRRLRIAIMPMRKFI